MNILLVNPYITDFTAFDHFLRPLGLLHIAGTLKKYTSCDLYWLDLLDRFQEGASPASPRAGSGKFYREFIDKPPIYKKVPRNYSRYGLPWNIFQDRLANLPEMDLILVTTLMTYWVDGLRQNIAGPEKQVSRAKTVLGGIVPSLTGDEGMAMVPAVDFVIRGYGETKILELISQLGGAVLPHPNLNPIDNLPFPAYEFLSDHSYLPLLTARGCPFTCTYCASRILNPRFLERRVDKILEEIEYHMQTFATSHFVLADDALLVNKKKRFLPLFKSLAGKTTCSFHTPNGLHPREIDQETAELFFACHFETLRLSFEAIQPEILEKSAQKVTRREMEAAVQHLEKAGYPRNKIEVYLLFGLPGQQVEDIAASLQFAADLGVVPRLSFFSPVPGTTEFLELQRRGILSTPHNLYETNKIYYLFCKSGIPQEKILELKQLATAIAIRNR